jgi:hypothetical protein
MKKRVVGTAGALVVLLAAGLTFPAHAAGVGAQVSHHSPCFFEPGDVPGVNVFFPADCVITVVTPSGRATIVAQGRLPAGFSLLLTFQGPIPCNFFGQSVTGHVTATTSGNVRATCHFRGVS